MPTQKRVFIVHGWDGYPDEGIFPFLKKELQNKGFAVFTPLMPDPLKPEIETWVQYLKEQIGTPDENTILFGHSIGAQTIMRYLESLPQNAKISGAIFLAGWVNLTDEAYETDEDVEIAKPWLETPLNWNKIKSHSDKFIAIFSDDDPLVPSSDAKIFADNLGAEIIIEHGKGHFSGSSGIKELQSAFDSVLKIAGEYKVECLESLSLRDHTGGKQKAKGYKKFKVMFKLGWSWFRKGRKWTRETFIMDKSKNSKYQSYIDETGKECHPGGIEDHIIDPDKSKGEDLKDIHNSL